jgi:hypothetical protein
MRRFFVKYEKPHESIAYHKEPMITTASKAQFMERNFDCSKKGLDIVEESGAAAIRAGLDYEEMLERILCPNMLQLGVRAQADP